MASWLVRWTSERSGFEPWSGSLCCVLGQDTLPPHFLCPPGISMGTVFIPGCRRVQPDSMLERNL